MICHGIFLCHFDSHGEISYFGSLREKRSFSELQQDLHNDKHVVKIGA